MAKQGAKTATPRLRFPEFRGTQAWEEKSLGELSEFFKGKGLPKSEIAADGEVQCIHYGELFTIYSEVINEVLGRTQAKSEAFLSSPNDVLMPTSDVTPNGLAKASCLKLGSVILGGDILVIRANQKILLGEFLARQIRHREREVLKLVSGTTVFHLYPSSVKNLRVAYPTAGEQQKIADCLTSLDEVIAAQGRKVEALRTHKRGLMQQLFPREGETRPRLRFAEFRDTPRWKRGKASDIVDVLQGYGFPERLQGSREGEFPFYKVSDISACVDAGGILLGEAKNHIDADVLEELRAKLMPIGSTVFAKIGEAIRSNKRAITSRPCLVDNNAAGVKAIAGLAHDRFVYYLWCQVALIECAGGVVPAVNKSAIEQIPVCYPEFDEQQRIADCLSSLDTQITAESNQLVALKTHKQGLMQQLFPAPEDASV